jgi:hypothetical protein
LCTQIHLRSTSTHLWKESNLKNAIPDPFTIKFYRNLPINFRSSLVFFTYKAKHRYGIKETLRVLKTSDKGRTRSGNALLECGLLQKVVLGAHIKNPKP